MGASGMDDRAAARILVMGIGNPDCGDDGIGTAVVQSLAGRLPAGVVLLARTGDMLSLIEDWADFDVLICADAALSMGMPGRIHRVDLATDDLPRDPRAMSSHGFGLADAICLARTLRCAPARIIVFAVEGCRFDPGAPVTPAVAGAAATVSDRILAEIDRLRRRMKENALRA